MRDIPRTPPRRVNTLWPDSVAIAKRHAVPCAAALVLFFGLNLLPMLIMGRSDSLGNNTDSIYHYLKILRLRGELSPDASLDIDIRLPTDERLYRGVSRIADATGCTLVQTLQATWCVYSVVFVAGSYVLGWRVTGLPWGGSFVAASGWGFAMALGGHWGWDFSPVVPHDLAGAFVPWLLLAWRRIRSPAHSALYFAGLGLMAQVYPTTFVHLAMVSLVAQFLLAPRRVMALLAGAAAFGVAIVPLAHTWVGRGPVPREVMPLLQERLSYLSPGSVAGLWAEYKLFLLHAGLSVCAALLISRRPQPPGWSRIRAVGVASIAAGIAGQFTARIAWCAPLFVSRASHYVFPWFFLLQARTLADRPRGWRLAAGLGLCAASLMLRPNLAGPARAVLRGATIRDAVAEFHMQDTNEFRALCTWINHHTVQTDVVLTPPDGRYLFLRAYARRPLVGLYKDLGAVTHARSPLLLTNWAMTRAMKRAFEACDYGRVYAMALSRECAAIVFPPEWPPRPEASFANAAGWVVRLKAPDSPAPIDTTMRGA
ncbi:hypothetical protein JXA88_08725 [Candidatus Fermentibacteria bacterium]|nr:hypothetical protein [Candidatus Fermentibacteria bacterium]